VTPFLSPEYAFLLLAALLLLLRAIEELRAPGEPEQAGSETVVATIYERKGRLVLRRRLDASAAPEEES
jgi:hypothetical protein